MTHGGVLVSRDWEDDARVAWEDGTETAEAIAHRFGVTKNTIIGLIKRREWYRETGPMPATMMQRLQKLNDDMDAVLAATLGVPRVRDSSLKKMMKGQGRA